MRTTLLRCLFLVLALTLACGGAAAKKKPAKVLELTLYTYSGAIRWGDFDRAYDYIDPADRAEHPMSDIDRARYKQVEVTRFEVKARSETADSVDRQVEIGLVNRNTQTERSISHHEHWRWDPKAQTWWLTTGLPDITAKE